MRLGLGIDQIGEALDLGEIELAVLERAARELARLGEAGGGEGEQRIEHGADHGAAAMQLQLGHVLAGEARRRREPEHEAAIEFRAARADVAQGRMTGRGHATAKRLERIARARTRDADHRNRRDAGAARQRNDGVVWGDDLGLHCVILGRSGRKGHAGADRR